MAAAVEAIAGFPSSRSLSVDDSVLSPDDEDDEDPEELLGDAREEMSSSSPSLEDEDEDEDDEEEREDVDEEEDDAASLFSAVASPAGASAPDEALAIAGPGARRRICRCNAVNASNSRCKAFRRLSCSLDNLHARYGSATALMAASHCTGLTD